MTPEDKILDIEIGGEDKLFLTAGKYGIYIDTLNSHRDVGFNTLFDKNDIKKIIAFMQDWLKSTHNT